MAQVSRSTVHIWGECYTPIIKPMPLPGSDSFKVKKADSNRDANFILDESGRLYVIGGSEAGLLGLGPDKHHVTVITEIVEMTGVKFRDISVGQNHVIAVSEKTGDLYTWGQNDCQQLGQNMPSAQYIAFPTKIENVKEHFVKCLAVENSSFAITEQGEVFAWGENTGGLLGLNHIQETQNRPTKVPKLTNVTDLSWRSYRYYNLYEEEIQTPRLSKQKIQTESCRIMIATSRNEELEAAEDQGQLEELKRAFSLGGKLSRQATKSVAQEFASQFIRGNTSADKVVKDLGFELKFNQICKTMDVINSKYKALLDLDQDILDRLFSQESGLESKGGRGLNLRGVINQFCEF